MYGYGKSNVEEGGALQSREIGTETGDIGHACLHGRTNLSKKTGNLPDMCPKGRFDTCRVGFRYSRFVIEMKFLQFLIN